MSCVINELDKNKTEQCIANETARLNSCKERLNRLKNEYEQKRYHFIHVILAEMEDKISGLESSIESGETFLQQCNEHLKDFEQ